MNTQTSCATPSPKSSCSTSATGSHFALQVWSTQYLQGEARLKSELNFAIREKLGDRGAEATGRRGLESIATRR